jgi:acyl carrier protein
MSIWLPSLLFAVVAIFVVWLNSHRSRRQVLHRLCERLPLNDPEFGQSFFPAEEREVATRLKQILARHVEVDLSRLHPDDRFIQDLFMDELDSLATVEFVLDVEKCFSISISHGNAAQLNTFRKVVHFVAERARAKGQPC